MQAHAPIDNSSGRVGGARPLVILLVTCLALAGCKGTGDKPINWPWKRDPIVPPAPPGVGAAPGDPYLPPVQPARGNQLPPPDISAVRLGIPVFDEAGAVRQVGFRP